MLHQLIWVDCFISQLLIMPNIREDKNTDSQFALLLEKHAIVIPQLGDEIEGTVLFASKSEVTLDLEGSLTGIVRGRELFNEAEEYGNLKPGDKVEATVIELENENGQVELSFRYAGIQKAWNKIMEAKDEGVIVKVKAMDANKGGLMVRLGSVKGFLPVSQLTPEHYPRVEGGDKNKILEILKSYINKEFSVKVMDANEKDDKLIVSEKMAWEEAQKEVMAKYSEGQTVQGKATAVTDFGVFVEFDDSMEGLVHISELAWQRIDNPRDLVKVGDTVEAKIIKIDGTKIFLSMKALQEDPWKNVAEKYKVGDMVQGIILKVNPFGLFVELDEDIHGLAHVSELSDKPVTNVHEIAKAGETKEFRIVSIEPTEHRLGLSLKPSAPKEEKKKEVTEEKVEA
jgi:small subunit ribosomal protein S1